LALSLAYCSILHSLDGEIAALDERAAELIAVATEQGFPVYHGVGTIFRGYAKVENGDLDEGILLLRKGLTAYRAAQTEVWIPHHIALLAGACGVAGLTEEALTLLDDSLEVVERSGERLFLAELNRYKGQLLLRQGHAEAAEELYCKALSIAVEQEAKMWELRAAVSLARLRRDQGRHIEAHDLLAPVYDWFTEGFTTRDLTEAKALLDELS